MTRQPALQPFLQRVPWLADLEPGLLDRLDRREWHLPSAAALARVRPLAEQAGVNLMFYRSSPDLVQGGLCTVLETAELSERHHRELQRAEAEDPGCAIVAYRRPLRLRGDATAAETL
jgi:hypothetical protein